LLAHHASTEPLPSNAGSPVSLAGRVFAGQCGVPLGDDDPQQPTFEIRVRAAKHEPDMFYINRCMRLVEDQLFG
jgi:hypothetical protein